LVVQVDFLRNSSFGLIPWGFNEMGDECFNILQVANLLNTEDDKTIPPPSMTVLEVPFDSAEQIGREANIINPLLSVEGVNTGRRMISFNL
jgi:hypothetical protein